MRRTIAVPAMTAVIFMAVGCSEDSGAGGSTGGNGGDPTGEHAPGDELAGCSGEGGAYEGTACFVDSREGNDSNPRPWGALRRRHGYRSV